ncbi:uncharacterized protein LOC134452219 [Engraulis encrasicolus]|uniref:uncharacterized protein LOC134452219 n=1 Tax=Engraulis encrasicolus TaxID=184585 RepID=UPI002FD29408
MNAYLHAELKQSKHSVPHPKPVLFKQDSAVPPVVRPKDDHRSQAQSSFGPSNPFPPVLQTPSGTPGASVNIHGPQNTNPAPVQHRLPSTHRNARTPTQASHAVSSGRPKPPPTVYDLMQRQNDITAQLVKNQALASLPPRVIAEYDGDPLKYAAFIRAFEQAIEKRTNDKEECLYYLDQYTRGQPRELVRSCFNMAHGQGYYRAKNLLKEHFGNEMRIAAAYIDKAMQWPVMKTDDVTALQSFSIFLRDCCNVMEDLQHLEEMNVPSNLRLMMTKLPYKMREKWRTTAWELQEKRGSRARFSDFVIFIERQVKILSDPLFGDLQGTPPPPSFKSKAGPSGSRHVTVAAVDAVRPPNPSAPQHQHGGPSAQRRVAILGPGKMSRSCPLFLYR